MPEDTPVYVLEEPVNRGNVADLLPPIEEWPTFKKHAVTSAVRIDGVFVVETSEGPLRCEDGWVAVDARGYPYPIADDEFEQIYTPTSATIDQQEDTP